MKVIVEIDGTETNDPNNLEGLEIELNYDKDSEAQAVSINNLELGVGDARDSNDGAIVSKKHIDDGLTGGVGVFEGKPLMIKLDDQKTKVFELFDGYLDLSKASVDCNLVVPPIVERGGIDWLNDVVDGFSFEYLESIGKIKSEDYVAVPFCKNKKDSAAEVIIAIITVFVVIDKVRGQSVEVQKSAARLSTPFGLTEIVALVFQILYLIVLIAALVRLVIDLYNTLVQPVKYHYVMYENVLVRKGLEHLGLNLSSSILDNTPFNKAAVMPEKFNTKENNTGLLEFVTGFFAPDPLEQQGFYKGTFGDLLRALKIKYNAKIIIDKKTNTVFFEKQNYSITSAAFTFPPVDVDTFEFNHEDFVSTRVLSFSTDLQDRNTIQEYSGTTIQVTTTPKVIDNPTMVLMRGLDEINIPFALAKRKTELNFIEKVLDGFFKIISPVVDGFVAVINAIIQGLNALIKALNKFIKALRVIGIKIKFRIPSIPSVSSPNFKNLIEDRIGMMVLESDYTSVPKMLLVGNNSNPRNNKLLSNNEEVQNAEYLWENYHYFSSFVPQQDSKGNQFKIRAVESIPFCFEDFEKVRTNKKVFDSDGNEGELISLKFNPFDQTASGSYKIQEVYTLNLKETKTISNGR